MTMSQNSNNESWEIVPSKVLLFDMLVSHKGIWVSIAAFCVGLAGMLLIWNMDLVRMEKHIPVLMGVCGVAILLGIILAAVKIFEFGRIRYVFTPGGFRVEAGINFMSDFEPYRKVTDSNIHRSIFEQITGCGTVQVIIDRHEQRIFRCVRDYEGLYNFFQGVVDDNFKDARRINSL